MKTLAMEKVDEKGAGLCESKDEIFSFCKQASLPSFIFCFLFLVCNQLIRPWWIRFLLGRQMLFSRLRDDLREAVLI